MTDLSPEGRAALEAAFSQRYGPNIARGYDEAQRMLDLAFAAGGAYMQRRAAEIVREECIEDGEPEQLRNLLKAIEELKP